MKKSISLILISILGFSPVVYSKTCTLKNSKLSTWHKKWPTMPVQETPGTQGFCANDGAISDKATPGTLTKILGVRSFYTNQWVADQNNKGYYSTIVFLELSANGVPFTTFTINTDNVINEGKPCRISSNGGTEPNQTTLVFPPNLDVDLIRDTPHGRIITEDNFIYAPIDPSTNLVNSFSNLRNTNFSTPGATSELTEIYYDRVNDLQTCPVYNEYFGSNNTLAVPDLEDDLTRVYKLEGGITMTGAQLRKILAGY